jgi:predicted metal-binding protein
MKKYIDEALRMGADDAVEFAIADIVFDPRTLLKCMYGCDDWGCGLTCPSRPGSPGLEFYKDALSRYKKGIVIHSRSKRMSHDISFEIERAAFLDGHYFAFSLSDCALCEKCAGFCGKACVHPDRARPAFHSVGIDVFATAAKLGLPLKVLQNKDETPDWYSAVFIE